MKEKGVCTGGMDERKVPCHGVRNISSLMEDKKENLEVLPRNCGTFSNTG